MQSTSPIPPAAHTAIASARALFRAAIVVVLSSWVLAYRGGFGGSDALLLGVFALAALLAGIAGSLVAPPPRWLAIALPVLAATAAAAWTLTSGLEARATLAGPASAERLRTWMPAILAALAALTALGAWAGAALHARFASRASRASRADDAR